MGVLARNGGVLCGNACVFERKGDILVPERGVGWRNGSVGRLDENGERGNGRS